MPFTRFLFSKDLFIYWKTELYIEREIKREREILHLLFHYANDHNIQGWAGLEAGAWGFILVSYVGAKCPSTGTSAAAFPGTVSLVPTIHHFLRKPEGLYQRPPRWVQSWTFSLQNYEFNKFLLKYLASCIVPLESKIIMDPYCCHLRYNERV